jgi:hypothetical protein
MRQYWEGSYGFWVWAWVRQLVRKVGLGRTELSLNHVNSVTSSFSAYNFVDLTINPVIGWGSVIQMEGR